MPSTKCTICDGAGKVAGHRVGAWADHVECPNCAGKGKIKALSTKYKINPVCIPSTHQQPDDPMSERIDSIIAALQTPKLNKYFWVIIYEYCVGGTQEQKAAKLGFSQQYFSKVLESAHNLISAALSEKKTPETVFYPVQASI